MLVGVHIVSHYLRVCIVRDFNDKKEMSVVSHVNSFAPEEIRDFGTYVCTAALLGFHKAPI